MLNQIFYFYILFMLLIPQNDDSFKLSVWCGEIEPDVKWSPGHKEF